MTTDNFIWSKRQVIVSYRKAIPQIDIKYDIEVETTKEPEPEMPTLKDTLQPNGPKAMLPYSSLYIFSPVNP